MENNELMRELSHSDPSSSSLAHHGIKDQKWGLRRFQNPDGSLTPAGRERYGVGQGRDGLTGDNRTGNGPGTGRNASVTKNLKEASRKSHTLSDEELLKRIGRLEKEKKYSDLVKEQKEKETGTIERLLKDAGQDFLKKSLSKAVTKAVDSFFPDSPKTEAFTAKKYEKADLYKLDTETLKQIKNWYETARGAEKAKYSYEHRNDPHENEKQNKKKD